MDGIKLRLFLKAFSDWIYFVNFNDGMTDQDYNHLQLLLGKLNAELKKNFCIIPNVIQDGYHMAIYSNNNGEVEKQTAGPDIKYCVTELLKP